MLPQLKIILFMLFYFSETLFPSDRDLAKSSVSRTRSIYPESSRCPEALLGPPQKMAQRKGQSGDILDLSGNGQLTKRILKLGNGERKEPDSISLASRMVVEFATVALLGDFVPCLVLFVSWQTLLRVAPTL